MPNVTNLVGNNLTSSIQEENSGSGRKEEEMPLKTKAVTEEFFRKQATQISIDWQGHQEYGSREQHTALKRKIVKMMCNEDFRLLPPEKQIEILAICQMHESDLLEVLRAFKGLTNYFNNYERDPETGGPLWKLDEECPKQPLTESEIQALKDKGLMEITIEAVRKKSLVLNTIDNICAAGYKVIGKSYRSYRSIISTVTSPISTLHRLTHPDEYRRNFQGEWVHRRRNFESDEIFFTDRIIIETPEHNQVNNSPSNEEIESNPEQK